jgi:hypothetical protein
MKTLQYSLCAGAVATGLALNANAQITMDGTLDANYGSALAAQTVNTGFGVSTSGDGTSSGGSEMDAGYGTIYGGYLYVFLAGNYEANGNHVNLFISDGAAGQSTLSTSGGSMGAMNGSQFSPGFNANLAIDLNDYSGTAYVEEYTGATLSGGYVGSFGLAGGIGNGTPGPNGILYGFNNTHVSTMGSPGTATSQAAMLAATTGLEVGIPLSLLAGYTSGPIEVLVTSTEAAMVILPINSFRVCRLARATWVEAGLSPVPVRAPSILVQHPVSISPWFPNPAP